MKSFSGIFQIAFPSALVLLLTAVATADDYAYSGLDSGKYVLSDKEVAGATILNAKSLNVDLFAGATYLYDSNTTQQPNGESAHVGIVDFGFNILSGNPNTRGGFYGFDYVGQAFFYENSAQQFGRDTLEHSLGAFVGVNGGKTRIRADVDYLRNNGNSIDFDNVNRETRRAPSHDFDFDVDVRRMLDHGSLEAGAGYVLRDFDSGSGLNDQDSVYGDLAWYFQPGFAPKTSLGFGFRGGEDDFSNNFSQTFYTPSVRARYRLSGKTSFNGSVGYEFRDVDGPGATDTEGTVFNGGMSFTPSPKTGFDLTFYRNNRPSYVTTGQDVNSTGTALRMTQRLPAQFTLRSSVGYENADYTNVVAGPASLREDNFWRFQTSLSHPLRIARGLNGDVSVFYHYNENDSTLVFTEFDQHIVGFRVGLLY
ncbi:MAG: outer membrane beta-barrel protein [Verrucomicrobiales bacterium]|nr:outer membrane beta-barrel protein [Verrucomicrobiales bacterium]